MSHELKTPLNAIIGFSDMMRNEILGPIGTPKYHEYIQAIYESGSHLLELIVDILDISRIEAGRYEVSLGEYSSVALLKECIALVILTATQKEIKITFQAPLFEDRLLYGDRRATKQVVLNLLNNAIKYCPEGSLVCVTLQSVQLSRGQDGILISVQDNGYGMPEKIIRQIGTPFISWNAVDIRQEGGTGLGLSIVKSLTEVQQGSVDIVLLPQGGTCVQVFLPLIVERGEGDPPSLEKAG